MNWLLRPEGGTRREWVRFHVGYSVAHLFIPAIVVGETIEGWASDVQARVMDWAERA